MKITNELLDNLIADQLNEDVNYTWKYGDSSPTPNTPGDKPVGDTGQQTFNRVARVVDPEENPLRLTADDINELIENPELITPAIEKSLNLMLSSTNDELKDLATKALQAKQDLLYSKVIDREQSVSKPSITSVGGEVGKYADDMKAIVDRFFSLGGRGSTTLTKRIQAISDFSAKMWDTTSRSVGTTSTSQLMNDILLLDIFNAIVKEFDHGSGAYLFEHFLAMIMGGSVSGKESGEGGGMGAVDFRWGDNKAGSAKFYASKNDIKQSTKGFSPGEVVSYVIGLKKTEGTRNRVGTSDPVRIVAVDVHIINAKRWSQGDFSVRPHLAKFQKVGIDGDKLLLSPHIGSDSLVGTIHLAATDTSSFKDMVSAKIDRAGSKFQKAFETMQIMFNEMVSAKENASKYISTGNIEDGNNALGNLDASENYFAELVSFLDYQHEVGKDSGEIEKLSEEVLDKMIKRVILESK